MDQETHDALHRTLNMAITAMKPLSDAGFSEGTLSGFRGDIERVRGWMAEVAKEYNE